MFKRCLYSGISYFYARKGKMRNERTHIRNIQTIWREVENITLDELSKQSGLSSGQLRKWESCKGMIKTSHGHLYPNEQEKVARMLDERQ